jgi:hypothetical protein
VRLGEELPEELNGAVVAVGDAQDVRFIGPQPERLGVPVAGLCQHFGCVGGASLDEQHKDLLGGVGGCLKRGGTRLFADNFRKQRFGVDPDPRESAVGPFDRSALVVAHQEAISW